MAAQDSLEKKSCGFHIVPAVVAGILFLFFLGGVFALGLDGCEVERFVQMEWVDTVP